MTSTPVTTGPIDLDAVRAGVDAVLNGFLQHKSATAARGNLPGDVTRCLGEFLTAGGKRLRPLLCVVGWYAAGGHDDPERVLRAAASLELFHAFALIHDDIMDNSPTRRGRATVHRALAAGRGHATDPDRWGAGAAILIGDMALAWSDELLHTTRPTPLLLHVVDSMREEIIYGQYLDLLAPDRPLTDVDAAFRVIRYKTAKYTIERPLHAGAALAGVGEAILEPMSRFAMPLGEAFQLRDDLLGVFGDPARTGKSVLDDLREGKHTVLLALAARNADPCQLALLRRLVGAPALDDDGAVDVRRVLEVTGARATVEGMIAARYQQALAAVDDLPCPSAAAGALRHIAALAVERAS
ncbi:polyprenyl synthetase family protein [Streptomyces sp. 549]|uniref:polyprenyl synthetase family protein n=1 Tax=Streptomyces sp. 549 TaxID=3049076 RepID=UPI0024C2EEE2|nr:polyprenyl synthetase family protein [Streptomyces sp. 549]MDK1475886.1 polyprenyl synthetase family protein [Streptomyces sp. 549]